MMIVHIKRNETTWETFTAANEEEALHKIRESYPQAAHGCEGISPDRCFAADRIVHVYERACSSERSSGLVARIREAS
jgi:hypothetical protein